jgi:4-amino-4-deoxy-L-arabinose transferase-like glycosyltransferase
MNVSVRHASGVAEASPAARTDNWVSMAKRVAGSRALPILVVAILTLVGAVIRLATANTGLFADEMSTYWIITTHSFDGVISTVHGNAEITPPLYFALSWLTTQLGHSPELVRAPSLVAGVASIPLMYLLGLRVLGRAAALVATALTALTPFMIYYSSEARGYAVMMALVMLSTLAMLIAADTGRARWWVVYGGASVAAMYTHYTCAFVLGAQLLWLLWTHPHARKPAILANLGALVVFLPWTTGVINDFNSPTTKILSALAPFTWTDARLSLEHWTVGYPYSTVGLRYLPGVPALVLLAVGLIVAVAGIAANVLRERPRPQLAKVDRGLVLVVLLAVSVPVCEAIVSSFSTHIFGGRNLAASWPGFALLLAALVVAPGPRLRFAATGLTLAAFAIGAAKMLDGPYLRPDIQAGAGFVNRHAAPGDVVVDETAAFSPGPLSPLDTALGRRHRVFRVGAPQERDHPFTLFDAVIPLPQAIPRIVAAAHGGRIFVVGHSFAGNPALLATIGNKKIDVGAAGGQRVVGKSGNAPSSTRGGRSAVRFPGGYRLAESRSYPGFPSVQVDVYVNRAAPGR